MFKIGARPSTAGYKAAEWNAPGALLWKGRLRLLSTHNAESSDKSSLEIRLEDPNTGELFASSPYEKDGKVCTLLFQRNRELNIRCEGD